VVTTPHARPRLARMAAWLQVHHQWYYSIGISAEYAHPVEFILGNALPFSAGAGVRALADGDEVSLCMLLRSPMACCCAAAVHCCRPAAVRRPPVHVVDVVPLPHLAHRRG